MIRFVMSASERVNAEFVGKIERAVPQNIALDAGKEAEVFELLVELADHRDLDAQPRFIEAARLDRAAAVVRDPEILEPEFLRRRRHFFQRIAPVTGSGMAMKCPAQIFRLEQAWKFPSRRGLKFAAVLAQLWRDVIEIEGAIEIGFLANGRGD